MVKILRVDDDVHEIISAMAQAEDRKITPFLNRHFRKHDDPNTRDFAETPPSPKISEYETLRAEKMEALKPVAEQMVQELKPILDAQKATNELHDKVLPPPLYTEKNKSGATPESTSDLFTVPIAEVQAAIELPCCLNETQPCKHWVWDVNTGDGYKNSLSGRFMEVE